MKLKKMNIARVASSFVAAFAIAVVPFASVNAATNVWNGTTNSAFGTATNWSTGIVPVDGDAIVFDSTATTTPYLAAPSLTNPTGTAFAGLTTQGTTGTHAFTIDNFKAQANATLVSSDTTKNSMTITNLVAQGNITLDGVSATNITVSNGGTVTLKHLIGGAGLTLPTTITGAGNIILDNDGTVTSSQILGYTQVAGSTVTISGTAPNATTLTLTTDALAANYKLIVSGVSVLTLAPNITITTPLTMTGGQVKMSGAGTTTVSSLTIPSGTPEYVLPSSAILFASVYTITNPATFTGGFGNAGTFAYATSGTQPPATTTTGGGGAVATTGGAAATTTTTTTPKAPNTAFSLALANPLMIVAATVAVVGATLGIMRYRKQQ